MRDEDNEDNYNYIRMHPYSCVAEGVGALPLTGTFGGCYVILRKLHHIVCTGFISPFQ